jgi:hypothetical protein
MTTRLFAGISGPQLRLHCISLLTASYSFLHDLPCTTFRFGRETLRSPVLFSRSTGVEKNPRDMSGYFALVAPEVRILSLVTRDAISNSGVMLSRPAEGTNYAKTASCIASLVGWSTAPTVVRSLNTGSTYPVDLR